MTRVGDALRYTRPVRRRPRPPGKFAIIRGEQIHYLDEGSGPVVVLVHGLLGNTFMWRHILPELAAGHRVIAVDLVGFGYSDRQNQLGLSLQAHAERLAELLTALGVERASLVGHSMGGAIVQRFAASYPERIDRLVLVASLNAERAPVWGAAAQRAYAAARYARFARRFPLAVRALTASALRRMATSPAGAGRDSVFAYSDPLLRPGTIEAFMALFEAVEAEAAIDPALIAAPVLIISGGLDRSVPPETGWRLASLIASSRHVVIDDAGHLCVEEHSAGLAALILEFFATTGMADT